MGYGRRICVTRRSAETGGASEILGFSACRVARTPRHWAYRAAGRFRPQAQTLGPASVADIAAQLQNAVVNITPTRRRSRQSRFGARGPKGSPFEEYFQDASTRKMWQQPRANSLGSGFVIDPKGFYRHNNHVIEGADEIPPSSTDGSKLKVLEGRRCAMPRPIWRCSG